VTTVDLSAQTPVGGRFSGALPWTGQPVVTVQDGGRRRAGGWVGSGSSTNPGSQADNGSATAVTGTWDGMYLSEGLNNATWVSNPANPNYYWGIDYVTGALEPHPAPAGFNTGSGFTGPLYGSNPSFPGYWGYYDNPFGGSQSGPDWTSLRDPGNWITVIEQPPNAVDPNTGQYYVTDTGSIKTSVANQYNFTPANVGVPISSFSSIRGYRNKLNPGGAGVNYDASWDLYGWAHTAAMQYSISLEVMFWTYWNGSQAPWNINPAILGSSPAESGLTFGDGNTWDLYLTFHNWDAATGAYDGGVSHAYSYAIWCLSDISGNGPQPQPDEGWIDILSPLRYFAANYVVPSGGAPADPLDIPIWQVIEGWEMASSDYAPLQFTHLDTRLEMS